MNERYNFIDLYRKEIDLDKETRVRISGVVVPKIQRPYVQGRKDQKSSSVRAKLLDELFATLQTDELFDFNFIYGIIRQKSPDEYVMELLDGQQRMTTLFLLYWYVANRELQVGDAADGEIRDVLKRFTYETRTTSTEFCQWLASYRVDLTDKNPSDVIRQAKLYFKSYDRDSTVIAMLTMLDAIHEHYELQANRSLLPKLANIRFYVTSLGYFRLSEELYIKMNARGLQLSPFENFKADLMDWIEKSDYAPFRELVPLYRKGSEELAEFQFNFSVKLDAKWIDLFWQNGGEEFDASYMSFFSRYLTCKYIVATKDSVTNQEMTQDEVVRNLYTDGEDRIEVNEYFGFKEFKEILDVHPEFVLTLDKVFDAFYEHDALIYEMMLPAWDRTEKKTGDDFYRNIDARMNQSKLIVFGAVIEFIEAYEQFDEDTFRQWMRVVWNIVENTDVNSLVPVASLIRKFSELAHCIAQKTSSEGCPFYQALSQMEYDEDAIIDEIFKAECILEDPEWLPIFSKAECHPFFKGMVLFFYPDEAEVFIDKFKHRYSFARDMFDEKGISPTYREDHLLIRAIVSQMTGWANIKERSITERSETEKYLKKLLILNNEIRSMMFDALGQADVASVKKTLQSYIDREQEFTPWIGASDLEKEHIRMAMNRLRNDVKLYDWISEREEKTKNVFRIYWREGHIFFAPPRKVYDRVALDTERAKIAYEIAKEFQLEYNDENQRRMFEAYGDSFGSEIWLSQERESCTLWVGFCSRHEVRIQFGCHTKKYAKELLDILPDGCSYVDDDKKWVQIVPMSHFKAEETIPALSKKLKELMKLA